MKSILTAGLTEQHVLDLTQEFGSSPHLRQRLIEILEQRISARRANACNIESYASPSWAFMQADVVGYERAMKEVISLLSSKNV